MNYEENKKLQIVHLLAEYYMPLLSKWNGYQMGDDDCAPSTEELEIIRPLMTILKDLQKEK